MSKKFIAAAVVAVFCVTAFASIATDADAAKQSYILFLEDVKVGTDSVTYDFGYVYFDAKNDDAADYVEKANAALAADNLGYIKLTLSEDKASIWVTSEKTIDIAQFHSKGNEWVMSAATAAEWLGTAKTAIMFNGYVSEEKYETLPAAVQDKFTYLGWGSGYDYIYEVAAEPAIGAMTDYTVFITYIKDDLVSFETVVIGFTAEKGILAWIDGFNWAVKDVKNTYISKMKAAYSEKYNSISIKDAGKVAAWMEVSKKKWEVCNNPGVDYVSGKNIDFEIGNGYISTEQYNGLSTSEKAFWVEPAYPMAGYDWMRTATGEVVEEAISLVFIIGIAGAIILAVIIAIVLIFIVRKKGKSSA